MTIQRTVCLSFSPTGATGRVVAAVAAALGAPETLVLDRTTFDSRWTGAALREGDFAVIGLPVYYGRVPRILEEFYREIKAEHIPAAVVVTYGNRDYGDALLELKNESAKCGFVPIAAAAFVGQHSLTDKLGTGRPSGDDLTLAAAFGRAVRALAEGTSHPESLTLEIKGAFPYGPGGDLPMAPATDGAKCTRCMLCQKNCPVQAIHPLDPAEIDAWRCLDCARCIANCPAGAKYWGVPALREKVAVMEAMFSTPRQPQFFYGSSAMQ